MENVEAKEKNVWLSHTIWVFFASKESLNEQKKNTKFFVVIKQVF